MINITSGKMKIPEKERFIGFVGDNLHSTKMFRFTDAVDTECEYKLCLEFSNGTKKDILLDSKVEENSTYLDWTISEKDILETGLIDARIKVTYPDSKVYHTTSDCFVAGPIEITKPDYSEKENYSDVFENKLNDIVTQITDIEKKGVPITRTIAGLSLENDITSQLLTESLNTYPVIRLSSAPTNQTEGKIGQLAFERSTTNGIDFDNRLYFCYHINQYNDYKWALLTNDNSDEINSVSDVQINTDGELLMSFSDGTNKNLGKVVGTDGENGKDGQKGIDGKDGINGVDGIDGTDGKSAYEYAKESGYTGTEEEFTQSLNYVNTVDTLVNEAVENEKGNLIDSLIAELQGLPVFGTVDENNIIKVTSQLSDGVYVLRYENTDGTYSEVGTITIGNGDVVSYINLNDPTLAIDEPLTPISIGWMEDVRISSSSSSISSAEGYDVSNFVTIPAGKEVVRIKNFNIYNAYGRIYFYSGGEYKYQLSNITTTGAAHFNTVNDNYAEITVAKLIECYQSAMGSSATFDSIRFGGTTNSTIQDVIITLDEAIT